MPFAKPTTPRGVRPRHYFLPWTTALLCCSLLNGCGKSTSQTADNDPGQVDRSAASMSLQDTSLENLTPEELPPSMPADQLNAQDWQVPKGDANQLLQFIQRIDQELGQMNGASYEAVLARVGPMLSAKLDAANRILNMKTDEAAREAAVEAKLGALAQQVDVGVPGLESQIGQFAQILVQDANPNIALKGRMMLLGMEIGNLRNGATTDIGSLKRGVLQLLANPNRNGEVMALAQEAVATMWQLQKIDDAHQLLKSVGQAFIDSPDQRNAAEAEKILNHMFIVESGLQQRINNVLLNQPDSDGPMFAALRQVLSRPDPSLDLFETLKGSLHSLEYTDHYDQAREMLALMKNAFAKHRDDEIKLQALTYVDNAQRRLDLVGQPFQLEAIHLDGTNFTWSAYQGTTVLVHFWSTLSPASVRELEALAKDYTMFRDRGVKVVTVNMDDNVQAARQYVSTRRMPWPVVAGRPLGIRSGVDQLPFMMLIDSTGRVAALHTRGERLMAKLAEMLPATDSNGQRVGSLPSANESSQARPLAVNNDYYFVSLPGEDQLQTDSGEPPPTRRSGSGGEDATDSEPTVNPYAPPSGLSRLGLMDFILGMQEKPKAIRLRPGFAEAVEEATDRLLADNPSQKYRQMAVLAALDSWHYRACWNNDSADQKALMTFVDRMASNPESADDEKINGAIHFFRLEQQSMNVDDLDEQALLELLLEVKRRLEEAPLTEQHLRMASNTVHTINQLEDGQQREKLFAEFGRLFAKSDYKPLRSYGRRLAKSSSPKVQNELIGKPLELTGITDLGAPLNWELYRGKVVLVDFWATWCGPCRRAMPQLKALYASRRDDDFDIVAVSLDDDLKGLATYLEENKIEWQNIVGADAKQLAEKFGVRGIPTIMLVDREGKVQAIEHQLAKLLPRVDALLN